MSVANGISIPWFEDPALGISLTKTSPDEESLCLQAAEGVLCEHELVLSPTEQCCDHCGTNDLPCVTPFMTYLFPYKVFCSAACVKQKLESRNLQPYRSVASRVELLDIGTKTELFGKTLKRRVKNGEDAKAFLERIKSVDEHIGSRFLERATLLENCIVRMAYLGQVEIPTGNWTTSDLQYPGIKGHDVARARIKQIAQQLQVPQISTQLDLLPKNNSTEQRKSFIAVSYCWHNFNWNLSPSVRNDNSDSSFPKCPISQKMFDAISFLRKDESEPIWLDQLCIAQSNQEEQRRAIASMDIIYSAARLVAIVLEDVELSREELREWRRLRERSRARRTTQGVNGPIEVDFETSSIVVSILTKICSARWITRAWCFHEFLLSQKYVFLVPCEGSVVLISPKVFQRAMEYRWGIPSMLGDVVYPARGFTYKFYTDLGYRSVTDLLVFLHSRRAQFLTDKLAILLNLYGKNLAYDGTEIKDDEFCYTCVVISLAEGDIGALCNSGPQLHISRSESKKSWARWPCQNRFFSIGPIPHTGTFKVISPYELVVDLYFLSGELVQPSINSMEVAWALFQSEDIPAMMRSITFGVRGTSQHFIEALAVGLDCGFDWIISVSRTIYEDFGVKRQTGLDNVFRDNRFRAERVASLLIKKSGLEVPQNLNANEAAEQILKFVLLVLAYELPLKATVLTTKSGSPVASTLGPAGTVLAVPKDLANGKYMAQNRLWFLEPTEGFDGVHWKIVCKGMLFSPMGLTEELGYVSLRNGQTISG
jgi:hypothetical protein